MLIHCSTKMVWMARYLLELSLVDGQCVAFLPVHLAGAALCLARQVLQEPPTPEGEAAWCLVSSLHIGSESVLLRIMSILASAAPLYVKPCRFSIKRQDKVPEIFYREDQVRAKFFNLYGSGSQAFDLSKSNFVSTCQRFVDKYTELKSRSELDDDALFEETAKALLEDGITLRRRGAPIVSAEAADSLLDLKLTDLLAEQQSISADSKETVESHTDPDEGPRAI
eukprot:XP_011619916.1 PREDICTED: 28S ribosomal protein S23, mitochondrial-like [Takifugu rubripes]